MRSLRPLAVLFALLFSACAARAEAWPTLESFVQECVLIVKCKTELKDNGARYRVLETWKGTYSPDLFPPRPPDDYLFTDTGHGNTNPTEGREVIFFFTKRNQPAFAKGKLVSHATCFVITAGKVIYASTSMPEPYGLRKEYTVEGFKKAVVAVVEKEAQRERDKGGAGPAAPPANLPESDPQEVFRKACERLVALEPKHELLTGLAKVQPAVATEQKRLKSATFVFDNNAVPPGKNPAKAKDEARPFFYVSVAIGSGHSQQPSADMQGFQWQGETYQAWVQVYGSDAELVKAVRKAVDEPLLGPPTPRQTDKPAESKPPTTRSRYEELAGQLKAFPTSEFAYGRGEQPLFYDLLPQEWAERWRTVYAAISASKEDTADLVGLLEHKDPKIRTLALAALYQREDGKLLPHLAGLLNDKERTFPELTIIRPFGEVKAPSPKEFREQTVGQVAKVLVEYWLQPAGYEAKDFARYWAARKDRPFCASWFLVRLQRAGQETYPFDRTRAPLIRAVRKDVDALPAADRDWTLLWVAAAYQNHSSDSRPVRIFATLKERLEAAQRVGPERLMDLLRDKAVSTDPDLAAGRGQVLFLWVLRHAGKLLRAEDAPAILAAEQTLPGRPPWCAIAAAELQPANARKGLREALGRFAGFANEYQRAELAAALWRLVGESEIDYLADWFYGEQVAKNPHTTQTQVFLRGIQAERAPANRKLAARLITDPRLEKLDYQSLRALVEVVNRWTKAPVIPERELRPNWERGTWGPESPADFQVLARWRDALKKSVLALSADADAGETAEALVARMTDQKTTWEERGTAEDQLAKRPPREVLPALLLHIAKGMPPGGIWNSAGREHDKRAPREWQVFYAVCRSWTHQVDKFPIGQGADFLHELLRKEPPAPAKIRLLSDLALRWTADAEPTVAKLFQDPKEKLGVRTTAGLALILEGKENYQELLLRFAAESSHEDRIKWYDLLADPRHKKRRGTDPRVVLLGFDLITGEQRRSPNNIGGAYFLAIKTGKYVGQDFMPDRTDPRYRAEGGLKDMFFQDTVKNALAWWERHKDKVKKDVQQNFPKPPLPGGNASLSELAKNSKGALVATLLEVGDPRPGPPGAADYPSKWKVERVLRGTYPAMAHLSFRVQSIPEKSRERPPAIGKTYLLISYEANANQVAAILDADEENLRKVQDLLRR